MLMRSLPVKGWLHHLAGVVERPERGLESADSLLVSYLGLKASRQEAAAIFRGT